MAKYFRAPSVNVNMVINCVTKLQDFFLKQAFFNISTQQRSLYSFNKRDFRIISLSFHDVLQLHSGNSC